MGVEDLVTDDDARDVVSAGGIIFDDKSPAAKPRKPTHADAPSRRAIAASQKALFEAAARQTQAAHQGGPAAGGRSSSLRDRRGVAAQPLQLDDDDFLDPNPPPPGRGKGSGPSPNPSPPVTASTAAASATRPGSRGMAKSNSSFLIRRAE